MKSFILSISLGALLAFTAHSQEKDDQGAQEGQRNARPESVRFGKKVETKQMGERSQKKKDKVTFGKKVAVKKKQKDVKKESKRPENKVVFGKKVDTVRVRSERGKKKGEEQKEKRDAGDQKE